MSEPLTLEAMEARILAMTPTQRADLEKKVQPFLERVWLSQPGPQTDAYYSEADELLYGGAAGGGKTDLLAGLATTAHKRSLIFRLQSVDLDGFWDRLNEIAEPIKVSNNNVKKVLTTSDGRVIEGGHLELPGAEKTWQGRPHDLIGVDEAAQHDEFKIEFVMRWLRSTDVKQRKRVVFATNPPLPEIRDGKMIDVGVGDWLLRWFAPWIDETYPNPAVPGELRWCYMKAEGDRLATIWVDTPGCYDPETAELVETAAQEDIDTGRVAVAKSRTFIRSLLSDNVFLKGTGYAERMSGTPEPLKSMLLNGDFTVKGEDHPMQIIPTQWVLEAQQRWRDVQSDPELKHLEQLVLFGDVAQGGADTSVISPLYLGDYFAELITKPGRETPDGPAVTYMILGARSHASLVGLDGTGGWAGDTYRTLKSDHNIEAVMVVSSHGSEEWTADERFKFGNVRTVMWWGFREALDPKSQYDIMLPPGARLRAQLTAPQWYARGKHMYVESKEELFKRLASSTDEADAVLGAWHLRPQALIEINQGKRDADVVERMNGRAGLSAKDDQVYEEYDGREEW